jgi:hypothetical protein
VAGTLEITDELCWMPAGWVYDNVLERLAMVLKASSPSLSTTLLQSRTHENGGYLDLRGCGTHHLSSLVQAADQAYAQVENEGANSFDDPAFYPGFMEQFQQLREMLRGAQRQPLRAEEHH